MTNETKDRIVLSFYDSPRDNFILDILNGLVSNKRNRSSKLKDIIYQHLYEHPELVELSKNNINTNNNEITITKDNSISNDIIDNLF